MCTSYNHHKPLKLQSSGCPVLFTGSQRTTKDTQHWLVSNDFNTDTFISPYVTYPTPVRLHTLLPRLSWEYFAKSRFSKVGLIPFNGYHPPYPGTPSPYHKARNYLCRLALLKLDNRSN